MICMHARDVMAMLHTSGNMYFRRNWNVDSNRNDSINWLTDLHSYVLSLLLLRYPMPIYVDIYFGIEIFGMINRKEPSLALSCTNYIIETMWTGYWHRGSFLLTENNPWHLHETAHESTNGPQWRKNPKKTVLPLYKYVVYALSGRIGLLSHINMHHLY